MILLNVKISDHYESFADHEVRIMYANELEDLISTGNLKKMLEYEKCDELKEEESINCTKLCPYFEIILNQRIEKGAIRRRSVESATDILRVVTACYVPKGCAENIFLFINQRIFLMMNRR